MQPSRIPSSQTADHHRLPRCQPLELRPGCGIDEVAPLDLPSRLARAIFPKRKIEMNDTSIIPLRRPLKILIDPDRFPLSTGGGRQSGSHSTQDPLQTLRAHLFCPGKSHPFAKLTSCQPHTVRLSGSCYLSSTALLLCRPWRPVGDHSEKLERLEPQRSTRRAACSICPSLTRTSTGSPHKCSG